MPLDGFTLGLVAEELHGALAGGRVDRVAQPEKDELILTVRNGGRNFLLLLSASADCARAHLTALKKTGPLEPPALCMLMRKHAVGGRINAVRQIDCDRILEIEIERPNELGDRVVMRLVCEFIGKRPNLIFVGGDGRIVDCARRVGDAMSSARETLPGLRYERPPAHGKIPYAEADAPRLAGALSGRSGPLWKLLTGSVSGLSPQLARELAFRATGSDDARVDPANAAAMAESAARALQGLRAEISPRTLRDANGDVADFAAFPYLSRSDLTPEPYPTLSEAMDAFYRDRDAAERIRQKSAALRRALRTNAERCERKLALQREALLGSRRMDEYRLKGELLTANLHLARKGDKSVDLPNYYEPDMPALTVELDEKLSPSQNAQRYFKLYQKARNAQTLAAEQIEKTSGELAYLEGQLDNLDKCAGESELSEIREELEKLGYVKANRNRRQMKSLPPSRPMRFASASGRTILVGRNNLQNDKLTFTAQPDEVWLHAKDMPGSHVVIVGENPDEATILEAARLAARYSKGGTSSRTPVDYTLRKYVKKPGGAMPGFVVYTHQRTLYVAPAEEPTPDPAKSEG